MVETGDQRARVACAAEAVKELRPLRGLAKAKSLTAPSLRLSVS